METLRDIVEGVMDATARRMGYSLNYTTINHIRNGTHGGRFHPRTLDAIAAVGGLSRERVFQAADLPLPGRPFASELPEDVDYLDHSSRKVVIGVIRELLAKSSPTRVVRPVQDDYVAAADESPDEDVERERRGE